MIFNLVVWFVFLWMASFLVHELMHIVEAWRQGAKTGVINVFRWGMTAEADYYHNQDMFMLAGGFYTGIILIVLAWTVKDSAVHVPLMMWAAAQAYYGVFEMKYRIALSTHLYKLGRYSIYILANLVVFVIYYLSGVVIV